MASKFCFVLLASSLAFLLVADASILRTTVAEVEEENPIRGSSCRQFRGMDLTPCMYWMKQHSGGGWEVNPRGGSSMYKNQCCSMMSSMDEDCMCKSLKYMMMDECESSPSSFQGQGGMCSYPMMKQMMKVPMMCGLKSEKCHFRMLVA